MKTGRFKKYSRSGHRILLPAWGLPLLLLLFSDFLEPILFCLCSFLCVVTEISAWFAQRSANDRVAISLEAGTKTSRASVGAVCRGACLRRPRAVCSSSLASPSACASVRVRQRGALWGLSGFLGPGMAFESPRNTFRLFKDPYGHITSQLFLKLFG